MKTKIVEHIAGEALHALREVESEAVNLRDKNPAVFADRSAGAGLDYAVMREKLKRAQDLLELLV
jgi:hypothetical protein